jgi:hypothetical protein
MGTENTAYITKCLILPLILQPNFESPVEDPPDPTFFNQNSKNAFTMRKKRYQNGNKHGCDGMDEDIEDVAYIMSLYPENESIQAKGPTKSRPSCILYSIFLLYDLK